MYYNTIYSKYLFVFNFRYFGSTYCHINNFIAIVSVAASVLNLTAMSIDRYVQMLCFHCTTDLRNDLIREKVFFNYQNFGKNVRN